MTTSPLSPSTLLPSVRTTYINIKGERPPLYNDSGYTGTNQTPMPDYLSLDTTVSTSADPMNPCLPICTLAHRLTRETFIPINNVISMLCLSYPSTVGPKYAVFVTSRSCQLVAAHSRQSACPVMHVCAYRVKSHGGRKLEKSALRCNVTLVGVTSRIFVKHKDRHVVGGLQRIHSFVSV